MFWLVTYHPAPALSGWHPGYHTIQESISLRYLSLDPMSVADPSDYASTPFLVLGERAELFENQVFAQTGATGADENAGHTRERWWIRGPAYDYE